MPDAGWTPDFPDWDFTLNELFSDMMGPWEYVTVLGVSSQYEAQLFDVYVQNFFKTSTIPFPNICRCSQNCSDVSFATTLTC